MVFQCFFILLFVLSLEKATTGQKIIWEDEYSTTSKNNIVHHNEFEGEPRSVKSESDSDVRRSFSGSSNNELTNKQYYYPQQPYPPSTMQIQYNNPFSQQQSGGGGSNWEWSISSATTQQSRKPSFIQFPGENFSHGPVPSSSSSHNSNARREPSSSIRVDENCHCGMVPFEKDSKKLQRIVGGTVSKENSWPWMVAVTYMGQSKPFWFCGGSLISDKHVLTAAHCLKTIRNFGLSNVKLIMGTNNLLDNKHASYYTINALRPHPMYKSGTEDYDIAVLEIKEKVNFTSRVSPICLNQDGSPFVNRTVTVTGWGSLQNGEGPPADLREVDLRVVSNELCQKEYYYNYRTTVTTSMICAWLQGQDSCQGDSGGPLFLKMPTSPYAYTQIGIVSFGPPSCGATSIPGVYSRVSSSVRWIKSITARNGKFCKGTF